jgi:hypothetical protein
LALCLATLAMSGVAAAQSTNSATELLNSPVKVDPVDFGPTVVRSAPWGGTANFGICEDLSDNTLWGTDLYTGNVLQYNKDLTPGGSFNSGLGIQVGIAYDHVADTFWILDPLVSVLIIEYDKTGTPTGNTVPLTGIPAGGLPGPMTIDPASPTVTWWLEDIGLDQVFQIDATGAVLRSHANPDDNPPGTGAYGNGLSYDAFDSFSSPGNLHIAAGLLSEGQVSRIYEGQPSAGIPRPYNEVLDVASFDSFINGIQNTVDPTASPDEVWYLQANSSGQIIEVNFVVPPPIIDCAPGGVNLGTQAPTPVFFDDMESGIEEPWWSHGAAIGVDDWAIVTTPNAQSPVNAWAAADDPTITDKYLDLTVDIAAPATELSFWHTFDFESFFDGGQLLASTDGGSSFTLLDSEILVGGYTGTFSTCCGNPAGGTAGWGNGVLGPMTEVVVDLSGYQGTGIVLRWRLVCDSSFGDDGWFIDDVGIRAPTACDGNLAQVLFLNRSAATTVFSDDMESGIEEAWWAHGAALGIDDWAIRSTPFASSPVNAWTCIDDTTFTDKYLDLTVDLGPTATELRFQHTFYIETGFDGCNLSISTDGGANFTLLDSEILEGGYTGVVSTFFGNPIGGQPAWTGGSAFGAMTPVRVDLSAYAPATGAIVRWRFGTDSCCGPGASGGYQLDDVETGAPAFAGTGGDDYTIELGTADPLSFLLDEPPSRVGDGQGTDACIYVWNAEPTASDVVIVPKGLGPMCFGVFAQPPTRLPKKIFNGIGIENKLGTNQSPIPPGIPEGGNFEFAKRVSGAGRAVTATLQGIIEDNCSQGTKPFSVTNGILLKVQ